MGRISDRDTGEEVCPSTLLKEECREVGIGVIYWILRVFRSSSHNESARVVGVFGHDKEVTFIWLFHSRASHYGIIKRKSSHTDSSGPRKRRTLVASRPSCK